MTDHEWIDDVVFLLSFRSCLFLLFIDVNHDNDTASFPFFVLFILQTLEEVNGIDWDEV